MIHVLTGSAISAPAAGAPMVLLSTVHCPSFAPRNAQLLSAHPIWLTGTTKQTTCLHRQRPEANNADPISIELAATPRGQSACRGVYSREALHSPASLTLPIT